MVRASDSAIRAISAPRRQQVLRLIWERELAAGEIHQAMPEVSFGAISQHLKILRDAGAVEVRRAGKHRYYRAQRETLGPLALWLEQMWSASLERLAELASLAERASLAEHASLAELAPAPKEERDE